MKKKYFLIKGENSFRGRVLHCIGDKDPYPWGKSIGLSDGVVTRLFSENGIPTAQHLLKISENLGKSINWLLTGNDNRFDKDDDSSKCQIQCTVKEKHVCAKLIEVLRHHDEIHKDVIEHNINLFCGDKLWVRMGRPERRKKPTARPGMPERRTKVFVYENVLS